jgi:hypothetical protein
MGKARSGRLGDPLRRYSIVTNSLIAQIVWVEAKGNIMGRNRYVALAIGFLFAVGALVAAPAFAHNGSNFEFHNKVISGAALDGCGTEDTEVLGVQLLEERLVFQIDPPYATTVNFRNACYLQDAQYWGRWSNTMSTNPSKWDLTNKDHLPEIKAGEKINALYDPFKKKVRNMWNKSRLESDKQFRRNLKQLCDEQVKENDLFSYNTARGMCKDIANEYYWAVRQAGASNYEPRNLDDWLAANGPN